MEVNTVVDVVTILLIISISPVLHCSGGEYYSCCADCYLLLLAQYFAIVEVNTVVDVVTTTHYC